MPRPCRPGAWCFTRSLIIALVVIYGACDSDNGKDKERDGGGGQDQGTSAGDSGIDTQVLPSNFGEGCTAVADCKKGSPLCLMDDRTFGVGVCSKECTPDNLATPLRNEDSCPLGFVCSPFDDGIAVYHYCLKLCTPSLTENPCPASSKRTCDPLAVRYSDKADRSVCWYPACETDKDCPVLSERTCTADGECSSLASDAFCAPEFGRCARPGTCTPGGLCGGHSLGKSGAKIGDPCRSDLDCPNNALCLEEDASAGRPEFRNGYCTIVGCAFGDKVSEFACPSGSTCYQLYYGGICAHTCKIDDAATCRPNERGGDYECYDWSGYSVGDVLISGAPVCSSAGPITCNTMPADSSCADLGLKGNPTHMECRDRSTGARKSEADDPTGVCLDDTTSGPFGSATDAGPDTRVPDGQVTSDGHPADARPADARPADAPHADSRGDGAKGN